MGVARLLMAARSAHVGESGWLETLSGVTFAQAQSLVSSVVRATDGADDASVALDAYFRRFPTASLVPPEEFTQAIGELSELSGRIEQWTHDDPFLRRLLEMTGLPVVALQSLRDLVVGTQLDLQGAELFQWAAQAVRGVLDQCVESVWYQSLVQRLKPRSPQAVVEAILAWCNGDPLASVIERFSINKRQAEQRRRSIDFLNHNLSLLSQFWSALAVCPEAPDARCSEPTAVQLRRFPALVREGAVNLPQLVWLREIGSLDRVLAHSLAAEGEAYNNYRGQRGYVRTQLRQYHRNPATIPQDLRDIEKLGLRSALQDIFERS